MGIIINYKGRRFGYGEWEEDMPDGIWFINNIEETMSALFPNIAWKFYYTKEDKNNDYKCSAVGYDGKYLLKILDLNGMEEPWLIDDEEDAVRKLDMMSSLMEFETKKDLLECSRKYGLEIRL